MNAITTILLIIFCTLVFKTIGQPSSKCDSIMVYNTEFDNQFQKEYNSIDADSILAIRHCYSTNGCSKSFGLLCWKIDSKFYFKKMQKKNGKYSISTKLSHDLTQQLIDFYNKNIFEQSEEIQEKNKYWIDDGPSTILIFKTKTKCWRFDYNTISNSKDLRSVWITELLQFMEK